MGGKRPSGAKALSTFCGVYGTTEVVPFQSVAWMPSSDFGWRGLDVEVDVLDAEGGVMGG